MEAKEIANNDTTKDVETIEAEDKDESYFQDIYLLVEGGIDKEDIEAMKKIGINTIKGLQMTTNSSLSKITGFNAKKTAEIREICNKMSLNVGFLTARELSEQMDKQIFRVSTGSNNFNKLLGGGIQSMSVTELFGESGTGKTQLAHSLCVTAQLPNNDYPGGKVLFIDTERTFRPARIRQIAQRHDLEENGVLENIVYVRAYNSEHQFQILKNVGARIHEEPGIFKLLIIDSIIAAFRSDFTGMGELTKRQQQLGQVMSIIQKISEEFNIAVLITNQIRSNVTKFPLLQEDGLFENESCKPAGGNVLAHRSTTRISLKKVVGNVRIAKVYSSPELEEGEESFVITSGGIADPNVTND